MNQQWRCRQFKGGAFKDLIGLVFEQFNQACARVSVNIKQNNTLDLCHRLESAFPEVII